MTALNLISKAHLLQFNPSWVSAFRYAHNLYFYKEFRYGVRQLDTQQIPLTPSRYRLRD